VLEHYDLTAFWFVYSSVIEGSAEKLEIYGKFRATKFDTIDEFYYAFFTRVCNSAYKNEVELSLAHYKHDLYRHFPHYSHSDTRFRYVRDFALGREKYHEVMDQMIVEHGVDIDELAADLWMNEAHVRDLFSRGHLIGLHSHTHPTMLAKMTVDEQEEEYTLNQKILKCIIGEIPETVSHPCNSYSPETLRILERLGVKLGFRANMENHMHSRYEYPRVDHTSIVSKAGF